MSEKSEEKEKNGTEESEAKVKFEEEKLEENEEKQNLDAESKIIRNQ